VIISLFPQFISQRRKAAKAPKQAPRSGVDEQSLQGVAQSKGYADEQMREGFSLSSAPGSKKD